MKIKITLNDNTIIESDYPDNMKEHEIKDNLNYLYSRNWKHYDYELRKGRSKSKCK